MKDDMQPMVRVEMGNGLAYHPQFKKNTKGEWEPIDPSFQEINRHRYDSEKRVKKAED